MRNTLLRNQLENSKQQCHNICHNMSLNIRNGTKQYSQFMDKKCNGFGTPNTEN